MKNKRPKHFFLLHNQQTQMIFKIVACNIIWCTAVVISRMFVSWRKKESRDIFASFLPSSQYFPSLFVLYFLSMYSCTTTKLTFLRRQFKYNHEEQYKKKLLFFLFLQQTFFSRTKNIFKIYIFTRKKMMAVEKESGLAAAFKIACNTIKCKAQWHCMDKCLYLAS